MQRKPKPNSFKTPMKSAREIIAKAGDKELLSQIEKLAKALEPAFARAIMAYLEGIKNSATLEDIIAALTAGDMAAVIGLLAGVDLGAQAEAVGHSLEAAIWGGAAIAAADINMSLKGIHFAFNRLNPRLITFLQNYQLNLIRQISQQVKEDIREKLATGMAAGKHPVAVAKEVRSAIGLTKSQAQAVANYRKELEGFHLKTSAKSWGLGNKVDTANSHQVLRLDDDGTPMDGIDARRLRDFRYDGKLQAALATKKPIPPAQIDKMVAAYERKYLRYRSMMIARTEALRATNYGVQDAWRQAIEVGKADESLVRRVWKVAHDERRCEICSAVPGLNPKKGVKFDQPFATPKGPVMLPPLHPACRCHVFIRQYEPIQLAEAA